MKPLRKYIPKPLRRFLLGWMARFGFLLGRITPRFIGLALFSFLGTVCYYVISREREKTIRNLKFIFGGGGGDNVYSDDSVNDKEKWSDKKIRAVAKRVFQSYGKNLFDAIHLNTLSDTKLHKIISADNLDDVRVCKESGAGAILVTAHAGCFEMLLHYFARVGFDVFAVGRAFKNPMIDNVVRKMRSGHGVGYVDRDEFARKIVRMLRGGKMMGVLVDQDTNVESVFADFLGHSASTPSGAVRFAMKFKIPIFVILTARLQNNKHHVFASPQIIPANTGDFENDLVQTMQEINNVISDHICKFPEQWVWMHERWKTKR